MKKVLFMWLSLVMMTATVSAQCTTCVPAFSGCSPNGGICGHAVVGMANHPYTTNISFYMPHKLNDPSILSQCSCNEVDLKEIKITGVGGLPTGIVYSFNHANPDYNVTNGDTLGCVSFCGTPLAAGTYPITIYIEAHVEAIGTPIGNVDPGPQNQTYVDTMYILPDTSGAVSSFNYSPHVKADCDSLRLTFNALLTAPSPNPTSYSWNFGNGQTSTLQNPTGTQFYSTQGRYPVSLQTVFYKYRVTKVFMSSVTGGYYGDVEELTSSFNPDPYFKIGSLGYTSAYVQDTKYNISFDNLNLVFPLGTDTFSMEVWDKDNGPPLGSNDDLLGTYTIQFVPGQTQYNWSNGNASGYIQYDTVFGTSIIDTLWVNIEGRPAKPTVLASVDSICQGDSARLVISPAYSNVKYEWWKDSTFLLAATDSVYYAHDGGLYRVRVTNLATGCSAVSDTPYTQLNVSGTIPTSATVFYDGSSNSVFLNPFLPGSYAEWYYNGALVTGHNGQILPSQGAGVYKAVVYPQGYPRCSLTSADFTIAPTGVIEAVSDVYDLSVFPNPSNGSFAIRAGVLSQGDATVRITDMLGREVYLRTLGHQSGEINCTVDISSLAKDVYTLQVSTATGRATRRIVIK